MLKLYSRNILHLKPSSYVGWMWIALLIFCLYGCEKSLNVKLVATPIINDDVFEKTAGLALPYDLYMPSSLLGWELSSTTQLHFDSGRKIYFLDDIPIDRPLLDDGGARFKLCSNGWRFQFGFGKDISDAESTFGIPPEGVVVQVEQFKEAANDMRIEIPEKLSSLSVRRMRLEFKLISNEPTPRGLVRITLH